MSAGYADGLLHMAMRQGDRRIASPRRHARTSNPLCGDDVELDVEDDGTAIAAVAHRVRGCLFTRASASVLEHAVSGMAISDALGLAATLRRDLARDADLPAHVAALAAVRVYPARVRCALLPWEALTKAFDAR